MAYTQKMVAVKAGFFKVLLKKTTLFLMAITSLDFSITKIEQVGSSFLNKKIKSHSKTTKEWLQKKSKNYTEGEFMQKIIFLFLLIFLSGCSHKHISVNNHYWYVEYEFFVEDTNISGKGKVGGISNITEVGIHFLQNTVKKSIQEKCKGKIARDDIKIIFTDIIEINKNEYQFLAQILAQKKQLKR